MNDILVCENRLRWEVARWAKESGKGTCIIFVLSCRTSENRLEKFHDLKMAPIAVDHSRKKTSQQILGGVRMEALSKKSDRGRSGKYSRTYNFSFSEVLDVPTRNNLENVFGMSHGWNLVAETSLFRHLGAWWGLPRRKGMERSLWEQRCSKTE